jgi:hypothetical protein
MALRHSLLFVLSGFIAIESLGQVSSEELVVYLKRVGPFEIGMPIDQVREVLQEPDAFLVQALRQRSPLPPEPDDTACGYLVSMALPEGIDLMFQFGLLERIDIRDSEISTASGARIGDTESRILELYGDRIVVRQHHYPPPGYHYMIFQPRDSEDTEYLLLFETDGSEVGGYRVGKKLAVEAPEGCA